MTYSSLKGAVGTEPLIVMGLTLDFCTLRYGVGACNAGQVASDTAQAGAATTITLAAGDTQADDYYNTMVIKITGGTGSGQERTISDYVNSTKVATVSEAWTTTPDATSTYTIHNVNSPSACYNTFRTCAAPDDYVKGSKTYKLCEQRAGLPVDQEFFPCLTGKISKSPAKAMPGDGLGKRAAISVYVSDFTDPDIFSDPYVANRTYDPLEQGTFMGRLLSRNPFHQYRDGYLDFGYLTDPYDAANFQRLYYVIEKIEGPFRRGDDISYKVTLKDILHKVTDKRTQVPEPSEGTLLSDITAGASSLTLDPAGIGSEYPTSGTYRIGDELGTYTRSGDTITLSTRGDWGTTAAEHDAGDTFQDCLVYNGVNVVTVIDDLLNKGGIDETMIPYDDGLAVPTGTPDEWDTERDTWLNYTITRVISEPTGVNDLVASICNENQILLWPDEVNQKIKLKKADVPPLNNAGVTELGDSNILENSLMVSLDEKSRISRQLMYYEKINQVEDEEVKNFGILSATIDAQKEGANQYGPAIKTIKSKWFRVGNTSTVVELAGRALSRFGDTPYLVKFAVDAADADLQIGDLVDINTMYIQGYDGSNLIRRFQIFSRKEKENGHSYEYEALQFYFSNRNGFIGPDTLDVYNNETENNKTNYAFVGPNTGYFDDGGETYRII